MKKKALMVVAGPYRLIQGFWIAHLYSQYEWNIVILRYSKSRQEWVTTIESAKKSELFNEIFTIEDAELFSGVMEKLFTFVKMVLYYFVGKKKKYCKKYLESKIGKFEYDLLCIGDAFSIFEGALLNFSDEINTIVIQDGLIDYINGGLVDDFVTSVAGYILYKMEYANCIGKWPYPPYLNCIKYATDPERLKNKYKKCYKMFDNTLVDKRIYHETLNKVYDIGTVEDYDVIVFTTPSLCPKDNSDCVKLGLYLKNEYSNKKILIKKHPRDVYEYQLSDIDVEFLFDNIPGEVIIQLFKKTEIIFAFPSTLMLSVVNDAKFKYKLIRFKEDMPITYYHKLNQLIDYLSIHENNIIDI